MHSSKKLNSYIVANLIITGIILVISILMHRISIIFFLNLILIGALNIALLNREKYSLDLLRKLKKLEDVDFPKFKEKIDLTSISQITKKVLSTPFMRKPIWKGCSEFLKELNTECPC